MPDLTRIKILNIISRNSNYPGLGASSVKESEIMYCYGSQDEFDQMIGKIEQEFDVILTLQQGKDIGEMHVKEFVDGMIEAIAKEEKYEFVQ
ncbi:hypothetical protein SAMN02799624_05344 [Paenibacillus sp. UNC496MF]|uniref:hypothetical protein n=1 Tax=Paenibacillus sp. UNC496MF TaxID=1502753 RepID=UPI0008E116F7|nr:hypothetical protein [Paenibacillus sp. UNC496MF]SFJ64481.1 hypothetical protein SAMN02799624_05344 [Paenibacillus sp. UNC496MF]